MENFTQKYTIVQLLEAMNEGDEYASSEWPLHVTIAGVFAVDLAEDALFEQLTALLSDQKPIAVSAARDEFFGTNKHTRVTLLDTAEELVALHYDVVELLKRTGAIFNTPQYNEKGFRPHATVRPQARLHRGDIVQFNALTIIDLFPNGDPNRRKVMKTIPLRR